jgi:serine/threonine-protein kinase HipA
MIAEVRLWGRTIGAVTIDGDDPIARFQYDADFVRSGIEVSPIEMPLSERVYAFRGLALRTFHGLPGLLADSLPDKFGNALINAWLATQGRTPAEFSAVERLCYTGSRGMGALEFVPANGPRQRASRPLEIDALVKLASDVLQHRSALHGSMHLDETSATLRDILLVGTSAGGARAKALIAWNRSTNEVRSGQIDAGEGFDYWLLKFDGVSGNRDKELDDPRGFGAVEYAYSMMAKAAGIEMTECRLLEEHGRRHFMTRRFDRSPRGEKLHMQSLCALAHFDFNLPGAYSYEQAMMVMRRIGLSAAELEQFYRRMVFNIVARNQDDHVKNIAFLMNKRGEWALAPAFDVMYSYNPNGDWTSTHQMSVNGKRDGFVKQDLEDCARAALLKRGHWKNVLDDVIAAVQQWPEYAADAGVEAPMAEQIRRTHRLALS